MAVIKDATMTQSAEDKTRMVKLDELDRQLSETESKLEKLSLRKAIAGWQDCGSR